MNPLSRRDWLRLTSMGALGVSMSGWLPRLAADTARAKERKRACILLWMPGGPSQTDTFDPKPDHENGGPFKPIKTNVPGLQLSEHLPKLAQHADRLALIRSMSTKEGDHARGSQHMRTGYLPSPPIQFPEIGPLIARELMRAEVALPGCVSIGASRIFSPFGSPAGFLGAQYAPLMVGDGFALTQDAPEKVLRMENAKPPSDVDDRRLEGRVGLLQEGEKEFHKRHVGTPIQSHEAAYARAVRLMRSDAGKAFQVDEEKDSLRDAYGRSLFGQGCLVARRLVERGVPFVEVALTGNRGISWDTHVNNFDTLKGDLLPALDGAWATLMTDLKERGLLDSTLIVWMGEFGRTPIINQSRGRDHYPKAWTTVLAGGGIKGGQAYGKTSKDGTTVESNPVATADLMATICQALGIDPTKQNQSNVGRPIRIADPAARPITEVVARG